LSRIYENIKKKIERGDFRKDTNIKFTVPSFDKLLFLLEKITDFPETVNDGLVNMERLQFIYNVVKHLRNFHKLQHNLIAIPVVQEYLEKIDVLDDKVLWYGSLYIEPAPNTSVEQHEKIKEIVSKRKKIEKIR